LRDTARERLLASLKRITGVEALAFDADGRLEMGAAADERHGSATARKILRAALDSGEVTSRITQARRPSISTDRRMDYINDVRHQRAHIWWLRLDFDDFGKITMSPRVRGLR
jgi:hypothetical protein